MSGLFIYVGGEKVGVLEQDDQDSVTFRYDLSWLRGPKATPLSRKLPLQEEVFRGKQVRAFFAGLLPEQEPRAKIARILGISEGNEFAMLERIGGECAGAITALPSHVEFSENVTFPNDLRELSEAELIDIIEELPRRPLMAGQSGVRLSLAGAQDKLPIIVKGGKVSLPLGNTPSTHIIKPEPNRFPGLVANEVFCMVLAARVGINVPKVTVITPGQRPCILIERYDRVIEGGKVQRLHQEDFCQALGYPPERKYQEEGGPGLREVVKLIREWSSISVLDLRAFLESLIFNTYIGNADAHGKNYSFLYAGGEKRLAPFYDLVSTLAWPEISTNMAMKIGGCQQINHIESSHWQKMAKECNIGWPMLRDRLYYQAERIQAELPRAVVTVKEMISTDVQNLCDIISKRTQKVLSAR